MGREGGKGGWEGEGGQVEEEGSIGEDQERI